MNSGTVSKTTISGEIKVVTEEKGDVEVLQKPITDIKLEVEDIYTAFYDPGNQEFYVYNDDEELYVYNSDWELADYYEEAYLAYEGTTVINGYVYGVDGNDLLKSDLQDIEEPIGEYTLPSIFVKAGTTYYFDYNYNNSGLTYHEGYFYMPAFMWASGEQSTNRRLALIKFSDTDLENLVIYDFLDLGSAGYNPTETRVTGADYYDGKIYLFFKLPTNEIKTYDTDLTYLGIVEDHDDGLYSCLFHVGYNFYRVKVSGDPVVQKYSYNQETTYETYDLKGEISINEMGGTIE